MKSLAVICVLSAFGSAALADLRNDVRCREIAFSKSVETMDSALFASFIDDDARFVANAVRKGPAAVAKAWSVFLAEDGPKIKWRPQFVEVLEDGKLTLTRGPYRMIALDEDGKETEHWGTFNSVWRLQVESRIRCRQSSERATIRRSAGIT